ncbi:AraC family transcriptional regulator [Burkholderia plantarii]|nr:helix-turn-helix transcriptional regulator [Burkholderia plantarii]GLZ22421.1 AraC family transcriptional regulator [Burkholderia plantarii]
MPDLERVVDVPVRRSRFDPDTHDGPVVAVRPDLKQIQAAPQPHFHRKGQLVVTRRGSVTCQVESGIWLVPPNFGVWIPRGMLHSSRVSSGGEVLMLFLEPDVAAMPDTCCTLTLSALVLELICHLAKQSQHYASDSPTGRLAVVLVEQLATMPVEYLHVPISSNPRLRRIATELAADPANRRTAAQWAARVALSERSLSRLVIAETGMTFGRWRRQLRLIVALQKLSVGTPVQRVSEDLGYESVNAFIAMFKSVFGRTPGHFFRRERCDGRIDGRSTDD